MKRRLPSLSVGMNSRPMPLASRAAASHFFCSNWRTTGRGKPQAGYEGRELAREMEHEHERHGHPHHDLAGDEKQTATIGILDVTLRGHPPQRSAHEDGGQGNDDADETDAEVLKDKPPLTAEGTLPRFEVAREAAHESRLFMESEGHRA